MAHRQAAAKVGAVVIFAILLMGAVVWFFVGRGVGGYPVDVTFGDAQGIKQGADVRLVGVKIGVVKDIDVADGGRRALLHLRINPKKKIPDGSVFTVTSGGLLGEMFVQITPPTRVTGNYLPTEGENTPVITGKDLPTFDQLKEQVAQLGEGSQSIVNKLNGMVTNLAKITNDPELQRSLKRTALNTEAVSGNAVRVSDQITRTTARLSSALDQELPTIHATMSNIESLSRASAPIPGKVIKAMDRATALMGSFDETTTFLRQTVSDMIEGTDLKPSLKTTLGNIAAASEQFKAIAADAKKISDDLATGTTANPQGTKVGELVTNVGKVADRASALLDKLTGVTDRAGRKRGKLINGSPTVGVYQRLNGPQPFRADVNLAIPRGSDSAIVLGIRDLGEGNRLNLQNSQVVSPRLKLRYGFHASKLGAGMDYSLGRASAPGVIANPLGTNSLSADLYDPNHMQLDVYGQHQLNDKMGLIVGVEDVLHRSRPTVGLTYRP